MTIAAWAGGEVRWQTTCKVKATPAEKMPE
jgi:hypothetical protein